MVIVECQASAVRQGEAKRHRFERRAFGQPIGNLQNTRFVLTEIATELDVTRAYHDAAVLAYNEGKLSAVDAAKVRWWTTEPQKSVIDRCLR